MQSFAEITAPNEPSRDRFGLALLYAPLIAVTVLSKFAVPPLGAHGLGIAFVVFAMVMAAGVLTARMIVEPRRLILYLSVIALLCLPQLLRPDPFSLSSLLLLAALHLVYVLRIEFATNVRTRALTFFLGLCAALALCGIAQFLLQLVVDARLLFPIENFAPRAIVVQLYNQQAPLYYGAELYRSNGVFLVEPSFFSQLLALAIIVELCSRNRLAYLALYALALLFSYSGTGLLILGVCMPLLVLVRRRWDLLIIGVCAALLLAAFREYPFLEALLARGGELSATGSSGYARFVGGFLMFDQFLWDDPWRALLGFGAGSFNEYAQFARYPASEMPVFKMIFEFGLAGTALYFGFIFYCVFATAAPLLVRTAIASTFLLNGMYMPFAHGLALSLLIWCAPARGLSAATQMPALRLPRDLIPSGGSR